MSTRIPPDAFDFYFSLGSDRSYKAVADRYGVTKRAVTKVAAREGWQRRAADLESQVREATDKKTVETREQMNSRHLRSLKIIQGKALEALRSMPIESAIDAVRSLGLSIKQERLIRGEPGDRTAVTMEQVVRDEFSRWMTHEEDDDGEDETEAEQASPIS